MNYKGALCHMAIAMSIKIYRRKHENKGNKSISTDTFASSKHLHWYILPAGTTHMLALLSQTITKTLAFSRMPGFYVSPNLSAI